MNSLFTASSNYSVCNSVDVKAPILTCRYRETRLEGRHYIGASLSSSMNLGTSYRMSRQHCDKPPDYKCSYVATLGGFSSIMFRNLEPRGSVSSYLIGDEHDMLLVSRRRIGIGARAVMF